MGVTEQGESLMGTMEELSVLRRQPPRRAPSTWVHASPVHREGCTPNQVDIGKRGKLSNTGSEARLGVAEQGPKASAGCQGKRNEPPCTHG